MRGHRLSGSGGARRPLCLLLLAAALAGPAARAGAVEPALRSPEVRPDGRLSFRLRAPQAEQALVVLEGFEPVAMARDEAGVWSHTTDPLPADLYTYFFVVDGQPRSDPLNPQGKPVITGGVVSIVRVSGTGSEVWQIGDAPRGTVRRHTYPSDAIGEQREYFVYTPPGYDPSAGRRYPALYLLHGLGDDASAWRVAGLADVILDNLIARGEAQPMLMVNPLGYAFPDPAGSLWEVVNDPPRHLRTQDVLASALLDEIVPRVERDYRAAPDRESRALAGLSMGGTQALYVGLNHLDRFAWLGSFSGAFMMLHEGYEQAFPALGESANERLRLLWIGCGEKDFVLGTNHQLRDWLEAKGLRFVWSETAGGHTWRVWRRYLADFARRLFRDPGQNGAR